MLKVRVLHMVKLRNGEGGCCEKFIMANSTKEAIDIAIKKFNGDVTSVEGKRICSENEIINL